MTQDQPQLTFHNWLWRLILVLAVAIASIIRHINVLSSMWPYLVWFGLGLMIGAIVRTLDHLLLTRWYQDKSTPDTKLITESTLFILCLIPVSLFVVTSSGSALGAGLILGLWISVLADFMAAPSHDVVQMRYLYQLKQTLTRTQIAWLIRATFLWLITLCVWVLF